ncbi:MAG TPA: response regulator [Thermoanaerobaculia bacterium]|nr:response regulator [Thermoanaerobaculia bacterium]
MNINAGGRRILVVDDDLAIRVLLQAVLTRMGFVADLAEDGEKGLGALEKKDPYDLILLDLMMPRINGYEFLKKVESSHAGERPHIIVFTAAGQRGVEKIPAHAVCNSILKPFDLHKFIELIGACIEERHSPCSNGDAE